MTYILSTYQRIRIPIIRLSFSDPFLWELIFLQWDKCGKSSKTMMSTIQRGAKAVNDRNNRVGLHRATTGVKQYARVSTEDLNRLYGEVPTSRYNDLQFTLPNYCLNSYRVAFISFAFFHSYTSSKCHIRGGIFASV